MYVISLPVDSLTVEIVASQRPAHTRVGVSTGCGKRYWAVLCFVDRVSRYSHLKKNQPDVQFVFSIFRQPPLHVSGVSTAHHQEEHRMETAVGIYCSF